VGSGAVTACEFHTAVERHPDLIFLGVRDGCIYVQNTAWDTVWEINPSSILEAGWEQMEQVLTSKRRPEVMNRCARIIGYYSNMRNWNRSKIAEAHDRQQGNYGVDGDAIDRPVVWEILGPGLPQEVVEIMARGSPEGMVCEVAG
jgi:hypothetical protein